jgi:hypothetical protein
VTIGLFEAIKTIGQTLINNLIKLFDQYGFEKYEGSNLNVMTTTLKSIMKCEVLGFHESFQNTCFGLFFFLRFVNLYIYKFT